jgi:predicted metal-dependent peptidase
MESTAIPTAGVTIDKETAQFVMLYNPDFFESMPEEQRLGVLMHEFYHLIFEHVTGRLPPEGMSKMWNVATDLAINSFLIGKLPEGGCIHKSLSKTILLRSRQNGTSPNFRMTRSSNSPKMVKAKGKAKALGMVTLPMVTVTAVAVVDYLTASMTTSMRKKIQDMVTPKVNWRSVLRYFVKTSQRANKRSTVRRINKRFPYIHAGKKVNRTAKIAISIDQSGSVSDQMLALFFAELSGLAKYAEFTVVPFDTVVQEDEVYVWKKGKKRTFERVSCGGTCFNAPTKWVNERNFDGHLILTDMEAPKPIPSKCQRGWVTTAECASRPYFTTQERIIVVDK